MKTKTFLSLGLAAILLMSVLLMCGCVGKNNLDECVSSDYLAERDCYISIAYNNFDVGVCEKMPEDTNDRQANKAFCLGFIAYVKDDVSICRKQQNQYYKNTCEIIFQRYMFEFENADEARALKEKYQNMRKNPYPRQQTTTTIKEVSVTSQDSSICERIQEQESKDGCYNKIAIAEKDHTLCDEIKNQDRKDICNYFIFTEIKDTEICDKIYDRDTQNLCYGIATSDVSSCEKIENPNPRYKCYYEVAILKRDIGICENIGEESQRNLCYKKTNN